MYASYISYATHLLFVLFTQENLEVLRFLHLSKQTPNEPATVLSPGDVRKPVGGCYCLGRSVGNFWGGHKRAIARGTRIEKKYSELQKKAQKSAEMQCFDVLTNLLSFNVVLLNV
jgi:hypothetical protein